MTWRLEVGDGGICSIYRDGKPYLHGVTVDDAIYRVTATDRNATSVLIIWPDGAREDRRLR